MVCVHCGRPWVPSIKNVCECGGVCSWGAKKGARPASWKEKDGKLVPRKPPQKDDQ